MKYPYKRLTINGKPVDEHRYIMEQFLGRKLERYESVHHINGNKLDNRIENLMIMNNREHARFHKIKYSKTKICIVCGKEFEPPIKHRARNTICSRECWLVHHKQEIVKQQIKIDQFSKDGTFIKTWKSLHEIERELGLQATNVCKCCKGKIKSLGGYVWKYTKESLKNGTE